MSAILLTVIQQPYNLSFFAWVALPAELIARRKQYKYCRGELLTFRKKEYEQ